MRSRRGRHGVIVPEARPHGGPRAIAPRRGRCEVARELTDDPGPYSSPDAFPFDFENSLTFIRRFHCFLVFFTRDHAHPLDGALTHRARRPEAVTVHTAA